MSKKSGLSFLWLSAVAFVVDLLTKYIVVQKFDLYESVNVLPVFNLTYVRNYGAAFSFLADHSGWQQYFFILLALAISGMLVYFLAKNNAQQKIQNSAYALIIGGALANMWIALTMVSSWISLISIGIFTIIQCLISPILPFVLAQVCWHWMLLRAKRKKYKINKQKSAVRNEDNFSESTRILCRCRSCH